MDEECGSESRMDVDLTAAGVSDCFHRLTIRGSIREFSCWPPRAASLCGIEELRGRPLVQKGEMWPMSNVCRWVGYGRSVLHKR